MQHSWHRCSMLLLQSCSQWAAEQLPCLVQASWDFMEEHGNTSGSSNLAVLHHELTRKQHHNRNYIICLAGGPGVIATSLRQ